MVLVCAPVALAPGILAVSGGVSTGLGLGRRPESEAGAKQGVGKLVGNRCWGRAVLLGWQRWQTALTGMCIYMCISILSVGLLCRVSTHVAWSFNTSLPEFEKNDSFFFSSLVLEHSAWH